MKNATHAKHRATQQLKSLAKSEYAIKYVTSPKSGYLVCPLNGEIQYKKLLSGG
jgi:hypothetical protein